MHDLQPEANASPDASKAGEETALVAAEVQSPPQPETPEEDSGLSKPFAEHPEPLPRRWWQLSIKGILLLTLICGIGLTWYRDRQSLLKRLQAAEELLKGSGNQSGNWGVEQMLGMPNTPGTGDISTAWASATQDGQKEWIELEYGASIRARLVEIHETYNPGGVYRVTAFDSRDREHTVWTGTDPTARNAGRGISRIPIAPPFATRKIRVYIDSPAVPGWNEIDAVGLHDGWGRVHWAKKADASSSYATGRFSLNPRTRSNLIITSPLPAQPPLPAK